MTPASILNKDAFRKATVNIYNVDELRKIEGLITTYLLNLPPEAPQAVRTVLWNGTLNIHPLSHKVFNGNEEVHLTRKEFDLLKFFMENKGKLLKPREILVAVWGVAHGDDAHREPAARRRARPGGAARGR